MTSWADMTQAEIDKEFERLNKKIDRFDRRLEMEQFMAKHDIGCFKCGSKFHYPVAVGTSRRGPWALCVVCARNRQARSPLDAKESGP